MLVKNVAEWLDHSAALFPDKIAFSDGKLSLSFAELRNFARRIGSELARRGLFKQPVMIALDKEPRAIAAFLGCAYSGNFYIPLDLEMPKDRVDKITEKLEPAATISKDSYAEFAESELDEALLAVATEKQIDTDLLYVLFTSGSTGTPKGVCCHHRGVIDYAENLTKVFKFDSDTIFGHSGPLFFDASILPMFQTIMNGGTDYLIPKTDLMFAAKTVNFLNEHKCNAIHWVPTGYNIIAKSGIFEKRTPEYLTKCSFGGEVMPANVLNVWRKAIPNAMFANLMGPAEGVGTYIYYILDREFADDEPIPVGNSYSNVQAIILNDQNCECKPSEIGELCIRGGKIAYGYYNDPERTAEVFVQNPLNKSYPEIIYRTGDLGYMNERGEIMFTGRKDFQIKHAGHRIELGETETAANGVDGVELCACVYDDKVKQIVLFFVGNAEISDIKAQLKLKLQPYMLPGRIEKIDAMPRTGSGKVSRQALKGRL